MAFLPALKLVSLTRAPSVKSRAAAHLDFAPGQKRHLLGGRGAVSHHEDVVDLLQPQEVVDMEPAVKPYPR